MTTEFDDGNSLVMKQAADMGGWHNMDAAPKDGTVIQVRYFDGVEGAARWLTKEHGKRGSKERLRRAELISRHGGYWANAKKTRPSRSLPALWKSISLATGAK